MTGADIISIAILITILIAVGVYLLHWLYRHSSKDQSFVRTGVGGERVVMGGGALVIPIIHDITVVNMNAIPIEVQRQGEQSLITRNKMRIDITTEFFVRVIATKEGVSLAARTLGARTMDSMALKEIIQGRLIDAMGTVAASMTMDEIHANRAQYVAEVAKRVETVINTEGLELETASLTFLNQASIDVFDPSNHFDAEGLTLIVRETEQRRKLRNQIENETKVEIKARDFEAEQKVIEIERDLEFVRLDQARDIEARKATQTAAIEAERSSSHIAVSRARIKAEEEAERVLIAKTRVIDEERINSENDVRALEIVKLRDTELTEITSKTRLETERLQTHQQIEAERLQVEESIEERNIARQHKIKLAQTKSQREVEDARVVAEREIEEMRVAARQYIERFEIEQSMETEIADKERLIAVVNKAIDEAVARTNEAQARKALALTEESIDTTRSEERARRAKTVEVIDAEARAERETIRLTKQAEAQKEASESRAAGDMAEANAAEYRYVVDAEGARRLNEAENLRSEETRRSAVLEGVVSRLPEIIREQVKPMENIDSIKILQVDGLPGLNSPSEGNGSGASAGTGAEGGNSGVGSVSDQVVNSAMKYRTQVAFVDGLMEEIGLPLKNLGAAGGMQFKNFPPRNDSDSDD